MVRSDDGVRPARNDWETIMSGQVVHFEIPADDIERATAFYRSAFRWDITSMEGMNYWGLTTTPSNDEGPLGPGAINGGMFEKEAQLRTPIITIDVDDIDAALARIEELGGATVQPKEDVAGMGFSAYFTDSEGNLMGLWQNVD
jgi:predicted enzyme related to lactoylglutathione lyase